MSEEIDQDLRRVAEITFQNRVAKLYDPVLRETKDLAEKFSNEGIASAVKYQRKVADKVFSKFDSVEPILNEILRRDLQEMREVDPAAYRRGDSRQRQVLIGLRGESLNSPTKPTRSGFCRSDRRLRTLQFQPAIWALPSA